MLKSLQNTGYAIIDAAMADGEAAALKAEAVQARVDGKLKPGHVGGGKQNTAERGDVLGWFEARVFGAVFDPTNEQLSHVLRG